MIIKNFWGAAQSWPEDTDLFEQNLAIGQSHMESGLWSAAVPFLRAAHQLVSARLKDQLSDPIDTMYDFSTASVLLILTYKKLARITEAFEIYALAIDRVGTLETPAELKAECIENINFQFPDPRLLLRRPSERLTAH